jgi:hypothetical protein
MDNSMAHDRHPNDKPRDKGRLFSTYTSAALLTGVMAGFVAVLASVGARPRGMWIILSTLSVTPILFLGPGIALRSWKRLTMGIALGLLLILFILFLNPLFLNGRLDLPLTVLISPWIRWAVPYYDDISLGWPARTLISFLCFWLLADALILLLRRKSRCNDTRTTALPAVRRVLAGAIAVSLSVCLAGCLYRLSWFAKVSGTFQLPLPDYSDLDYTLSVVVYGLLYPINAWLVNFLYNLFVGWHNKRQTSKGAVARIGAP